MSLWLAGGLVLAGQPAADRVYRPGDGVEPPKVVHRVEPRYTAEARRNMIQGSALLEVVVDESGKAARITVLSPLGFGLDDRAVQAVSRWRFEPGRKNGQPVKTVSTVEVNFRIFHRWFDSANETRRTTFNVAVDAIQRHLQTAQTLETIRNLAQQKYPPAMYLYAKLLQAGDGFPRDPDAAFPLIVEAAGRHYPAAMYEMGRMMMEGHRMPPDPERGLELARNAAVLRNHRAQFYLGASYASGDRVPVDRARAAQYFRMCAAAGETPCQVQLAKLLLNRPDREERDLIQAIAWLELSADGGNPEAKLILDQHRGVLSAKEASWVNKLKPQLAVYQ